MTMVDCKVSRLFCDPEGAADIIVLTVLLLLEVAIHWLTIVLLEARLKHNKYTYI